MDDDDEPGFEDTRPLRGFRKRWASSSVADGFSNGNAEQVYEETNLLGDISSCGYSPGSGWDLLPMDPHVDSGEVAGEQEIFLDGSDRVPHVEVVDPQGLEPAWKQCALAALSKRQKLEREKLPWEQPMMSTIFRTGDRWSGTILSGTSDMFIPTGIGISEILNSTTAQRSSAVDASEGADPPVIRLNVKRVRKELPDEDIRRLALSKLRDLILQDPMASQLGSSISSMVGAGCTSPIVELSISDCFRSKASATLQKRSSSLWRLAKVFRQLGFLNFLRMTEEQLYTALCTMRDSGAGATSAQHMVEAIFFLDSTIKLQLIDVRSVVSGRCRGVAKDMYLTKNPLEQKQPLLVTQVKTLEALFGSLPTPLQCILGQLLFCIHACCRWKDAQRIKSLAVESGHGETVIHAEALSSKTSLSAEQKTRFMPYVALGSGVSQTDWGSAWLEARDVEGLQFTEFALPSYFERTAQWTTSPMSASEATFWLREFLSGNLDLASVFKYGSHSCKTTLLTWAGRCTQVMFSPSERRLLGHHMDPHMKSVLTYSREGYTSLYSKVLGMFRLIRTGDFDPDMSAIDRIVQFPETVPADTAAGLSGAMQAGEDVSDSESSVASECGEAGDESFRFMPPDQMHMTSLFPDFPGVPENMLFVHKVSGLVHAANEDDFFLCGRKPSVNFKMYGSMVGDRHLCEGCSQCKKVFASQRADESCT